MYTTNDEVTRDILNKIRNIRESSNNTFEGKRLIKEENENNNRSKSIAITDDPKFGENALSNQIAQFKASVETGAQFTKASEDNVSESPLVYIPATNNLIFSGTIPRLNNLKFQFELKTTTGNGCFIWADDSKGLILNKENIQILNKLYGFYQNWVEQWDSEAGDLEKMVSSMMEK